MRQREVAALIIIASVLVFSALGWGFTYPFVRRGVMGPWMMGFGGMWLMMLAAAVFWVMIGLGIYLFITGYWAKPAKESQTSEYDKALAIARERYARGEITLEQFEEIKKNLK